MYSPWTTSMPCLFSNLQTNLTYNNSTDCLTNSFNNLNLSNPLNFLAGASIRPLNHFPTEHKEVPANYFEPLPFFETNYQSKYKTQPQLSQKHTMIKQMIARKDKQLSTFQRSNHLSAANSYGRKRQICTFCKSNGESASVYTSHVLRNAHREIQCPVLLAYVCPKCGATGKSAHTIKYCTALSENERVALPTVKNFKEGRSSSGKKNLFKK